MITLTTLTNKDNTIYVTVTFSFLTNFDGEFFRIYIPKYDAV